VGSQGEEWSGRRTEAETLTWRSDELLGPRPKAVATEQRNATKGTVTRIPCPNDEIGQKCMRKQSKWDKRDEPKLSGMQDLL
jgi:hypothetical protein